MLTAGKLQTIDYSKANSTDVSGINDNGVMTGQYGVNNGIAGFVLSNGTFTTFNFPGTKTFPQGINIKGELVGPYEETNSMVAHGFL